ncbi:epoxide hydrolase [Zopfochytrium polystomum]|nr:epoxide hydrolase [Zopfochytrium polystomum]
MGPSGVKAVIFDLGGVVVHSPLEGIRTYERKVGLPQNFLNERGASGSFQRLERRELTLAEFYPLFSSELSEPRNWDVYYQYLLKRGVKELPTPKHIQIDGEELFRTMMKMSETPDLLVVEAIKRLRASKRYKLAALTNNVDFGDSDILGPPNVELVSLFDHFIESSVVGMRKPDPQFYLFACKELGVQPTEAIFLDDIGVNLKAAQDLGMKTIRVFVGKSRLAIEELSRLVDIDLIGGEGRGKL